MDNFSDRPRRSPKVSIDALFYSKPHISADDAARFAHELIGNKRDREYGGMILLRDDGRFVATEPLAAKGDRFDFKRLLAVDAQGRFLHPEGFKCHALYRSHPNGGAELKAANPAFTDEQIEVIVSFFTERDKLFMIRNREFVPAFYLSGSEGSLFRYMPSGSAAEDLLAEKIRNGRPEGPFTFFEAPIEELAQAGALSLVYNTRGVWGSRRGQFDAEWAMHEPVNKLTEPTEPPFCTPIYDQASSVVEAIMSVDTLSVGFGFSGFVFKVLDKDEYVGTFPWRNPSTLVSPLNDFPLHETGGPSLRPELRLDGIFYMAQTKAAQVPAKQEWLYRNFFSPVHLAAAITQSRKDTYLLDPERSLTVYTRTPDKALLSYTCSGSAAETKLMASRGKLQKALQHGTLSPFEFVLQVAAAGRLEVVQTGAVWDKAGPVGAGWRPFERIHRSLSPAFVTADDAARYAHFRHGKSRDAEQLGYLLQRSDGKYFATASTTAKAWAKDWNLPFAGGVSGKPVELPGYRYVALYKMLKDPRQTLRTQHPDWSDDRISLLASLPSFASLAAIASSRDWVTTLYNSGPDGSLVKYVASGSQDERNFGAFLTSAVNDGRVVATLDGFDGTGMQMVKKLVTLGELNIVISSPVWKASRGKVPGSWVAFEPFTPATPVTPGFSWVFQDPGTAAQWVHDQMQAKPGVRQLAFILKSLTADEYVVSEPLGNDPAQVSLPLFSPLHVFTVDEAGKPRLPEGYGIHALCYQPAPDSRETSRQKWLYENFVSASDFAAAIGSARVRETPGLALYLSTRDGAQLRYTFSGSEKENQLYAVNPHGRVSDNGDQAELAAGTLTPEAFVRRVAAAGALSVVRAGRLWDVEGEVGLAWQPYGRYPKPALSPAFLTADDAVRYAHERIGKQRDYEFCGYVMERQDGRFVVSEPWVVGESGRFAPGYVYPDDASGKPILPEDHRLRGVYASRLALSQYDPQRMARHGWNREQASIDAQFFCDADLHAILGNRQHATTAWLCAAEDALIAYDISGSAAENVLRAQVAPEAKGSRLAQDLARGAMLPGDLVKQLADAGGLRVVIASELWGARGMVPEYWSAFPASQSADVSEPVAFGAVFADADAAARDAHQRVRRCGPDQTCFGVVLKHADKEEYVVSETRPASDEQPLFTLGNLFKSDDAGEFLYPASFKLFGLFYARQWLPKKLPPSEQWLGRHFISSKDLYEGFFQARRLRAKDEKIGLPVYLSTLDRALLKYRSPNSTTLFDARMLPSGVAEDVHSLLSSGALLAKAFVDRVIARCWLSVVVGSDCWGEAGPVRLTTDWKPYAGFTRRALSPAFTCQADAVRHVQSMTGVDREQVHGGLVLKRTDGLFVATEPLPVESEDFDPKQILPDEDVAADLLAPGCKIVARYRNRVASALPFLISGLERQTYSDFFSTEVLATALASGHLWTHEYLLGAQGSMLCFTQQNDDSDLLNTSQKIQRAARLALLEGQLTPSTDAPHDPWSNLIERRIRSGAGTPTELVNQLLKVGGVQVVQSSNLWGPAGKLGGGWLPQAQGYLAPQSVRFATADRALSPAFCHSDDAVRHAHQHAGERGQWAFGLVLKSSRPGHSVTSLPVTADDLKFPHGRIFQSGQLPTGYSVQGLYLCAPARQPDELPSNEVFRSFVPPSVLVAALSAVQIASVEAPFQPLYLSCADGALLKYEAAAWDSDLQTHAALTAYVKTLQGDGNPADYIRKVARAGQLNVLVPSATWATLGRVGSDWSPGKVEQSTVSDDERLALGPVYSHADDAARWVWRRVRHARDKAWLGAILRDGNGNFVATEPLDDSGPTVPVGLRDDTPAHRRLFMGVMYPGYSGTAKRYPSGYRVMGVQQAWKLDDNPQRFSSRFEEVLYRNFVDHDEIRAFNALLSTARIADARYYLTPRNGALLAHSPSYLDREAQVLLDDWTAVEKGVTRSRLAEVLDVLILTGRLQILEPDRFWYPRGPLTTTRLQEMSRRPSAT